MSNPKFHEAYFRLCDVLTNTAADERTSFDESHEYEPAMQAMVAGREAEAVALIKKHQSEAGDKWREKAFGHGLIPTLRFVNWDEIVQPNKKLGDMNAAEREAAIRKALYKLQDELDATSVDIAKVLFSEEVDGL